MTLSRGGQQVASLPTKRRARKLPGHVETQGLFGAERSAPLSMTGGLPAFLAILPILLAGVLLVGLRMPAKWAMPIVYVVAVLLALFAWQVELVRHDSQLHKGLVR